MNLSGKYQAKKSRYFSEKWQEYGIKYLYSERT